MNKFKIKIIYGKESLEELIIKTIIREMENETNS